MFSRFLILAGALTGALAVPVSSGAGPRSDFEEPTMLIITFSYDTAGNRIFRSSRPEINPGIEPGIQPEPNPGEQPVPGPDPDPDPPVDPGDGEIPEVPGN